MEAGVIAGKEWWFWQTMGNPNGGFTSLIVSEKGEAVDKI